MRNPLKYGLASWARVVSRPGGLGGEWRPSCGSSFADQLQTLAQLLFDNSQRHRTSRVFRSWRVPAKKRCHNEAISSLKGCNWNGTE
jgi:hypothetical protein